MAATLAWIKSRMLLPPDGTRPRKRAPDPRAELVARLLEYQRFKEVADALGARPLLGRDVFAAPGAALEPPSEGEREIEVGLLELVEALRRVLRESKAADSIHEVVERADHGARAHDRRDGRARAAPRSSSSSDVLRGADGGSADARDHRRDLPRDPRARASSRRCASSRVSPKPGAPEGPIRLRRAGDPRAALAPRSREQGRGTMEPQERRRILEALLAFVAPSR